eukprot:3679995-Amphidinium_carterae.2
MGGVVTSNGKAGRSMQSSVFDPNASAYHQEWLNAKKHVLTCFNNSVLELFRPSVKFANFSICYLGSNLGE